MKKTLFFCITFLYCFNTIQAHCNLDSLFRELDNKIENRALYIELKEHKIEELKAKKARTKRSVDRTYTINSEIFNEYRSYISDSAIQYLNYNLDIAYDLHDQSKINETSIIAADIFSALGMYKEALDLMKNVNKQYLNKTQEIEYYSAYRQIYSGIALYTQNSRDRSNYWEIDHAYRDSIIEQADENSEISLRLREIIVREQGKIQEALELNDRRLEHIKMGTPGYALITFHRSLLYRKKGDKKLEKKYLILSSMSDIQSAIKDNASITSLANIMMQEKNVAKAYKYIRLSLDNINDYNTRIRSSEIINVQSIIDKAYQEKTNEQRSKLRLSLIITSVLSILLIISVCYVYKQLKKGIMISKCLKKTNLELNALNQKLHDVNHTLKKRNSEVTEANQIKEEYIGYFLDQCSKYIEKLDNFRKMTNKKLQDKELDKLYKISKDNTLKEEELKELFVNFDTMFVHLFPDFIEKFNSLLHDDEQIILKKGEVLNSELRIYALIRLGIDDSTKIASFLGYSVNTIYNYRTKTRNKAKCSREDFEWKVKKIGTFRK